MPDPDELLDQMIEMVACERLGHDVMMLLGTYTHTMDDQHDRAAEALDTLLAQ